MQTPEPTTPTPREADRPLGELIRELVATLGEYLKQQAADAVDRALSQPLQRAARKVMLLGLAFGAATMAAIMLALAFFNVLAELFGVKSAAYAVTAVVCIILGGLCAWAVFRDGKPRPKPKPGAPGDRGGSRPAVGPDPQ